MSVYLLYTSIVVIVFSDKIDWRNFIGEQNDRKAGQSGEPPAAGFRQTNSTRSLPLP